MKNHLKRLRNEREYSQARMGELLGVSRQTINSIEAGRYNPSILLAFKIAGIFNRPIEEIFIYEEEGEV